MSTKELTLLWICEGFVTKSITKSSRIVAKEYLSDPVDRSLVTAVRRSGRGGIQSCRLHDLVHDFCLRKAEEDNFIWLKDGHEVSNSSNSKVHNPYCVSTKMDGVSFDDVELTVLQNLHSLICHGRVDKPEFVMENLFVQVFHLERIYDVLFFHRLIHLRYLFIYSMNQLREIPESICKLWNLEILIVNSVLIDSELPKTIWKIKMLRHLEVREGCELGMDDDDDNEGCHQLLENMEFLSNLCLLDDVIAITVLRRLPNIQKLICTLHGSGWTDKVFTIDFLEKLESFCIVCQDRFQACVPAIIFPSSLKRIEFHFWNQDEGVEDILSAMGELPCLEVLKIDGFLKRWDVEDEQFQKLKYLQVQIRLLDQWNVSFDSFSCLDQLEFVHCDKLEETPPFFSELPTLQRIEVERNCNAKLKSSAIQVQKEHKESGNEVQLEIYGEDVD